MTKIIISMLLLLSVNLYADVVDDGLKAYQKGDIALASELYKKGCDSGNAKGCLNLGIFYFTGKGVKSNPKKAKKLFLKACKKGQSQACYYLGTIYKRGAEGVVRDTAKAKKFYSYGCSFGFTPSCKQFFLIREKNEEVGSGANVVDKGYTYSRPDIYGG